MLRIYPKNSFCCLTSPLYYTFGNRSKSSETLNKEWLDELKNEETNSTLSIGHICSTALTSLASYSMTKYLSPYPLKLFWIIELSSSHFDYTISSDPLSSKHKAYSRLISISIVWSAFWVNFMKLENSKNEVLEIDGKVWFEHERSFEWRKLLNFGESSWEML